MRAITYTDKGSTTQRSDKKDIRVKVECPEGCVLLEVWATKKYGTRVAISVNDDQTAAGSNLLANFSMSELLAADFLDTGNNGEEN